MTESIHEETKASDILHKDLKTCILDTFKELKKNIDKELK